jgi:hypothetical protein
MTATWCDSSLDFQETLVREALDSLAHDLVLIERSVLLTSEVNNETKDAMDEDSYDTNLPQKIDRFREYLARLRTAVAQLKEIQR